ncbi:MAG TPA: SUF system NifU family Fe-S cluster assembly protein, partial [Nitrosomonas sp.]|nr:SUF system NifU family Fe-S cluster assembly protein [Nitrosomonas sp.]
MNSKTIYQEVILDHNRKPRNYGSLDQPSHHAVGHNPLCGDRIDLGLDMINNQINQIAFQGESCAICKASASMMTTAVKGKSPAEAKILIQEFR